MNVILTKPLDETAPLQAVWRDDVLPGGAMMVQAGGHVLEGAEWGNRLYRRASGGIPSRKPVPLTAIPYYAWANRGANAMRVWIPRLVAF